MRSARFLLLLLVVVALSGCKKHHEEQGVTDEQMNAINEKMSAVEAKQAQDEAERKFAQPPLGFAARELPAELSQESVIGAIESCFAPNRVVKLDGFYGNEKNVIVCFTWTAPDSDHQGPGQFHFRQVGSEWQPGRDVKLVKRGRVVNHTCY